jgi:hypothetical protein
MRTVNIQNIPNQMFSTVLNGDVYRIALRTIQGNTYMSVWLNDDILFYNQICTPNGFVNPYNYVSNGGKFFFRCSDEEYPNYAKFNKTQKLLFLNEEEVSEIQ